MVMSFRYCISDCVHCAVEQPHGIPPGCRWTWSADVVHGPTAGSAHESAEVLFGKEHVLEPNFAAAMSYPAEYKHSDEEGLHGVEYAMCQSSSFTARDDFALKGKNLAN